MFKLVSEDRQRKSTVLRDNQEEAFQAEGPA